jgi:hypothetical protein
MLDQETLSSDASERGYFVESYRAERLYREQATLILARIYAKSVFYTFLGGVSYTNSMFLSSHLSYKIKTSIITVNIPRTLPSLEVT